MKERQSPAGTGPHPNTRSNFTTAFGPRHRRLLQSLLRGPITREQADRIAHASNSPHYIGELRKRFGIPVRLRMAPSTDFDGQKIKYGIYWLDETGKAATYALLGERGHE